MLAIKGKKERVKRILQYLSQEMPIDTGCTNITQRIQDWLEIVGPKVIGGCKGYECSILAHLPSMHQYIPDFIVKQLKDRDFTLR